MISGIHMDGQDRQDKKGGIRNPEYPFYPCLKSLLLVKRLYSSFNPLSSPSCLSMFSLSCRRIPNWTIAA